jgi:hypothetical protein
MNRYIQQFINENEDLIDNDEWDTIYAKLWSLFGQSTVSEFTRVVIEAGIFPIRKMTAIPYGYRFNDLSLQVEIIPDNITEIKDEAYAWCSKLQLLKFDCTNCTTIHKGAFSFCELLDRVVIPSCVTEIRSDAFAGCTNLRSLKLKEGIQSIESRAFLGTKLSEVELPRSLIMLGLSVFPPTCTVKIYRGSDIEQVVRSHKYKVEYID